MLSQYVSFMSFDINQVCNGHILCSEAAALIFVCPTLSRLPPRRRGVMRESGRELRREPEDDLGIINCQRLGSVPGWVAVDNKANCSVTTIPDRTRGHLTDDRVWSSLASTEAFHHSALRSVFLSLAPLALF